MEFLPHIVFINLDKRTDRLRQITEELTRMGLADRAERYSAIYTPENGAIGCTESHLNVLKLARERGWEHVLVLEDDFKFIVDRRTFYGRIREFFSRGMSFDVLMLSYSLCQHEPIDFLIGRTKSVQTASGYIVHRRFYDTLIATLEDGLALLKETGDVHTYINDQYWKRVQPDYVWYYFRNRIGIQRPSYSDLLNRPVNYGV
jgi:glycosyl transferase family 25